MTERILKIGEKYRVTVPKDVRTTEDLSEGDFVSCNFCKATVEVKKTNGERRERI